MELTYKQYTVGPAICNIFGMRVFHYLNDVSFTLFLAHKPAHKPHATEKEDETRELPCQRPRRDGQGTARAAGP